MPPSLKLGYLVLTVRRRDRWAAFCGKVLGLPEPVTNIDGSCGYRLDEAAQRLILEEGAADDLAAIGLECADDSVLDALAARLAGAGHAVTQASPAETAARRVQGLCWTTDPEGNRVELHVGPQRAAQPFESALVPGGFRTGEFGLGHAVLIARDPAATERFYVDLLGFAVTERLETEIGPITLRGTFMHCNRRHHSLALFELPLRKRLHHFMLETNATADVGAAFDRAQRHKVPLSLSLGQHPAPEGTFSFYGCTPSGFDFEIGAASKEIEPAGWTALQMGNSGMWGHTPQLGLKIRMAKEMLIRRLGF